MSTVREFLLTVTSPRPKPSSPFSDNEITKIRRDVRAVEEEFGEQLSPDDRSEVIQIFKAAGDDAGATIKLWREISGRAE
jgi:hypothetical protein